VDALPINFSGISLQEGEEHGNEVFDKHFGQLFSTYERQNYVQTLAGFAAPLLPMRTLSMALAGTDFAHHRAFVHAAEQYRRMIQRAMNGDIAEHAKPGVVYTAGPGLWDTVPDFAYDAPSTGWALKENWLSLSLMVGWCLAALTFATTGASRLRVD
jgi:ABC-2 type transport system permease protein